MLSARPAASGPALPIASSDPTPLRDAAARCGVSLFDDEYGTQSRMPGDAGDGPAPFERLAAGAFSLLPGHAILAAHGEDTRRFLHSQTTNDVEHQAPGEARWHGYCGPKGRLLATMLAWRDGDSMRLLLPEPTAESIRKRLTMFVLRAKVRIVDETGSVAVFGLAGGRAADALASLQLPAPPPMSVATGASGTIVGLAPIATGQAPLPRWLLVVPVASFDAVWATLSVSLAAIGSATWRWTDVRAGIAPIVAATSEQFVPQMLNFEAVGGVSFTKGCYPGQEVVARSHYLGKLKRRSFLGRLPPGAPEPAPGADVCDQRNEPVGKVVVAAPSPAGGVDLFYEAQVGAAQSGTLAVAGTPIESLPLPYPLPAT